MPLSDMLFGAAYKVYVGFFARRFTCGASQEAVRVADTTRRVDKAG